MRQSVDLIRFTVPLISNERAFVCAGRRGDLIDDLVEIALDWMFVTKTRHFEGKLLDNATEM